MNKEVVVRLGNAVFWICIVAAVCLVVELFLMDDHYYETMFFGWARINGDSMLLLQALLVLATYAIGVAARYTLNGNSNWKPWRRDTYR